VGGKYKKRVGGKYKKRVGVHSDNDRRYALVMSIKNAKQLRKNPTEAEKKLWHVLRQRQLNGHYFRRQAAIGPYVADFVCFKKGLIIEVDGGQHAQNKEHDEKRTQWLQGEGFKVIRLWNNDVLENLDGVLRSICAVLKESPPS